MIRKRKRMDGRYLLEELRQNGVPTRDVLLERQVELERRDGGRVTLDSAQLPALLVVLEAQVQGAASEAAGLGLGHG